jgi:hypothetical protein
MYMPCSSNIIEASVSYQGRNLALGYLPTYRGTKLGTYLDKYIGEKKASDRDRFF